MAHGAYVSEGTFLLVRYHTKVIHHRLSHTFITCPAKGTPSADESLCG